MKTTKKQYDLYVVGAGPFTVVAFDLQYSSDGNIYTFKDSDNNTISLFPIKRTIINKIINI